MLFDSTKADRDNSHDLSVIESAALAAALSIDSLATGFSAGLGMTEWQMTSGGCFDSGGMSAFGNRRRFYREAAVKKNQGGFVDTQRERF